MSEDSIQGKYILTEFMWNQILFPIHSAMEYWANLNIVQPKLSDMENVASVFVVSHKLHLY